MVYFSSLVQLYSKTVTEGEYMSQHSYHIPIRFREQLNGQLYVIVITTFKVKHIRLSGDVRLSVP